MAGVPGTAALVGAAVRVAASAGVRSDDPRVLADGANVVVHLRPAPLVAKVAARTHVLREPAPWLARELAVSEHLAGCGVPVTRASPLLPARVHEGDGAVLTFWRHEPHDPAGEVAPADLGRLLRELHAALRSCTVPLPRMATAFDDVGRWLDGARETAPAGMRAAYERLLVDLGGPEPGDQALHGDPHPGNLLVAPHGPVWTDLEDTCRGPVAWDLACLAASRRTDGEAALRAYGDVPDLGPWRELRRLQATVWYQVYADRSARHRAGAAELLASWS